MPSSIKIGAHCIFETKSAQFWVKIRNFQMSCLRIANLTSSGSIALQLYSIFGTKFCCNGETDTCFKVEFVLLGCNFDFFGGYLVVTPRYLVITARYQVVIGGHCSLLVVTAHYRSLLLVSTFSMNNFYAPFHRP